MMTKRTAGRPAFEPTDEQRRNVEAMTGYGIPQDEICRLIVNPQTDKAISRPTLEKHFRQELDTGQVKANARVAESLYKKALGDGPSSVTAAIWWTKTRMGWKEQIDHNVEGRMVFERKTYDISEDMLPKSDRKLNGNGAAHHSDS